MLHLHMLQLLINMSINAAIIQTFPQMTNFDQ